jgi:hypothetical protein
MTGRMDTIKKEPLHSRRLTPRRLPTFENILVCGTVIKGESR